MFIIQIIIEERAQRVSYIYILQWTLRVKT
jgi:hypothetical protein